MIELEIHINDSLHFFVVPSTWDEMSKKDLKKTLEILVSKRTDEEKRIEVFFILIGAKKKDKELILSLSPLEIHSITFNKSIEWVWNGGISLYLFQRWWFRCVFFTGPRKSVTNLRFIELVSAFSNFSLYHKTKKTEYLDKLIVSVWRPFNLLDPIVKYFPNYENDPRIKISQNRMNRWAKVVSRFPMWLKMGLFLQFAGMWEKFQKRFPLLLPKVEDGEGKEDPMAWVKIIQQVSADGIFGTMKEVEMADAEKVFLYVEEKTRQGLELRDKYGNN